MSQFSFSSSVRSSMIIELVLVIPRSTGLDYKIGVPGSKSTSAAKSVPAVQRKQGAPGAKETQGKKSPAR